ncbi:hypothetical protein TNCV_356901 [Trichonephila clavipes]|nr:hypothetical protein TNCV_356901 [Trichonephila clavipes]
MSQRLNLDDVEVRSQIRKENVSSSPVSQSLDSSPASGKWHVTYGVPAPERGVPPHQNFRIKGRNSDFT